VRNYFHIKGLARHPARMPAGFPSSGPAERRHSPMNRSFNAFTKVFHAAHNVIEEIHAIMA
jgi:hypothetical protein